MIHLERVVRVISLARTTKETDIKIKLNLDGKGQYKNETGIGFFDHMLDQLARHGFMDMFIECRGDLQVDAHHTVEDVGILLGQALREELKDMDGRFRYGSMLLPMDEVLVRCAVDLGGRPYLVYDVPFTIDRLGNMETELFKEFFKAFVDHSKINLHVKVIESGNNHHMIEGVFKAVAKALDQAKKRDPRIMGVLSTKGSLEG